MARMRFTRKLLFALLICLGLRVEAATLPAQVDGAPLPSLAPMLEKVTPAVVNISTVSAMRSEDHPLLRDPFFRWFFELPRDTPKKRSQSLGSGVIVDAKHGYVLTNHHVIENATEIHVTLNDGRELKAALLGSDPETDVALLQIEAVDLNAIPTGNSNQLRVGDLIVRLNDHPINTSTDLNTQLALIRVGDRVVVQIIRDGRKKRLRAKIADPFEDFVKGRTIGRRFRGAMLGEVIDESNLGRNPGIAVGPVEEDSGAWKSGLREGDVLFQVNRSRVKTLEQLREAAEERISRIKLRRGKRLVTLVSR